MKIKLTGFMFFAYGSTTEIQFFGSDMSEYGYVKIAPFETEVDFEMPEGFSPIMSAVGSLNAQIEKLDADRDRRVMIIKEKIANLLCLTLEPADESGDA